MEKQMCLPKTNLARHQLTLEGGNFPSSIVTPHETPRITHRQFSGERSSPLICLSANSLKKKKSDPPSYRGHFFFRGESIWENSATNQLMTPPILGYPRRSTIVWGKRLSNELNNLGIDSNRT